MITLQISQRTSTNRYLRKIILFRFAEAKKEMICQKKSALHFFCLYLVKNF